MRRLSVRTSHYSALFAAVIGLISALALGAVIWSGGEMTKEDIIGLDTAASEGGDNFSAGEKQLLSIARALLADPRILILDEATAAIDSVTEKTIQEAIKTAIKGRTSFVIAHRLSTIVNADLIILVNEGRIVESGSHTELMRKKGEYYKLYTRQYEAISVDM